MFEMEKFKNIRDILIYLKDEQIQVAIHSYGGEPKSGSIVILKQSTIFEEKNLNIISQVGEDFFIWETYKIRKKDWNNNNTIKFTFKRIYAISSVIKIEDLFDSELIID